MLLNGFFALGVASLALAARPVKRVAHETRRSLPTGWTPVRRAEPDRVLPLSVGLVQSNLENLEAYLLDVSDPDSPNYGKHWTPARVADTFRPSPASVDAVRTWLVKDGQIGVDRIALSGSGAWLVANVTVDEAEQLLGTEYYVYQHEEDGREHLACHQGYHLPEHVSKHVDLITPTLHFDTKVTRHGSAEPAPALIGSAKNIGKVAGPQVGGVVHVRSALSRHGASADRTLGRTSSVTWRPATRPSRSRASAFCTTLCTLRSRLKRTRSALVRTRFRIIFAVADPCTVEYTPQSHNATDFDVFFANYSKSQIGERPKLVPIDGGTDL